MIAKILFNCFGFGQYQKRLVNGISAKAPIIWNEKTALLCDHCRLSWTLKVSATVIGAIKVGQLGHFLQDFQKNAHFIQESHIFLPWKGLFSAGGTQLVLFCDQLGVLLGLLSLYGSSPLYLRLWFMFYREHRFVIPGRVFFRFLFPKFLFLLVLAILKFFQGFQSD